MKRKHVLWMTSFAALAAICIWELSALHDAWVLHFAEGYLGAGYNVFAAEYVEPMRAPLARSERGCRDLLAIYTGSGSFEKLRWTTEACQLSGIAIPELYLALARIKEAEHSDDGAVEVLKAGLDKLGPSPILYRKLVEVVNRSKPKK